MAFRNIRIAAIAFLLAIVGGSFTPAAAQIKFEFGDADKIVVAALQARGFSEIKIIANELFQVRVEACKESVRYRFKFRIDGNISDIRKIGECGAITVEKARAILINAGYDDVEVYERDGGFIAFGCQSGNRMRLIMRADGKITHAKKVGQCQSDLSRGEIAALLRKQGFEEIEFQQSEPPDFVIHACLGQAKFELVVTRQGKIRNERRIGLCGQSIDPAQIPAILAKLGFTRIEVTDDQLPHYVAVGCKDGNRVEVTLNRFGQVVKTQRLGACAKRLSEAEITAILDKRGFRRIQIVKSSDERYTIDACYKRRSLRMVFTVYGDFISENDRGACQSLRASEILRELEGRGVDNPRIYVEGCRNHRQLRFPVDELGDSGEGEQTGRC